MPPPFRSQGTYQPGICASCVEAGPDEGEGAAKRGRPRPGTKVNLEFNTGAGQEAWIQAVAGEIQQVLGWKVNIVPVPFKTLLKNMSDPKASGLFRFSMGCGLPDGLGLPRPAARYPAGQQPRKNSGRYSNPAFDKLLAEGQAETDAAKRAADYRAAEKLAIGQDLALIPLWYRTQYRVFNPKFVGSQRRLLREPDARHHRAEVARLRSSGRVILADGPASRRNRASRSSLSRVLAATAITGRRAIGRRCDGC